MPVQPSGLQSCCLPFFCKYYTTLMSTHCQQYLPLASWHPASPSSTSDFAVQLSVQGPGHPAVVFSAIWLQPLKRRGWALRGPRRPGSGAGGQCCQ
jgi:hypothetical protein